MKGGEKNRMESMDRIKKIIVDRLGVDESKITENSSFVDGLGLDSFDGAGNYSMGIAEHIIFPEVNPNTTKSTRSLQVTIVSSGKNKEVNKALLTYLGMPFKKEE